MLTLVVTKKLSSINPRHLKASVFGANDGIITTFAVVAGVAGAGFSSNVIIVLGIANLIADGLSMGLGDFLGEKSERKFRKGQHSAVIKGKIWETGLIIFISFATAGSLPLAPYLIENFISIPINKFLLSSITTALSMFLVGSLRTYFIKGNWWKNGFEMLGIGAIAAVVAFVLGMWIEMAVS